MLFNFPLKNIEINYIGSVKIIDWCIKNNCKFVFLSSSAVYGNRDKKKKIKETDQLNPETIYGINKLAIEKFIRISLCSKRKLSIFFNEFLKWKKKYNTQL